MRLLPARESLTPPMAAAALALVALAICLFAPGVLNDGDTFWHIRAGEWMLDHRAVLHHDVFSFTKAGAPWSTHEWLAEVMLACAWRAGGWPGVLLLTGLTFGGAILIVGRALGRRLDGLLLATLLALVIACAAPFLVARPHILALPLLAGWTAMLLRARDAGEAPPLAGALLIALWANLHGGYFFGLALAGFFGLEALLATAPRDRVRVARDWAAFGLLSGLAALATPHGVAGVLFPFQLLGMSALAGITEWRPTDFSEHGAFQLVLLALLVLALVRPLRLPVTRAVLLAGLVYLALSHVRHQLLFAFIAPLILAEPLRQALAAPQPGPAPRWTAAALAMVAAGLATVRLAVPLVLPEGPTAPRGVADALPHGLLARPGLNAYDYGGYLIWIGGRSFVDGRADLFGDDFMGRYYALQKGDPVALDEALARWRIEWTMMPAGSPVVTLMDRRPGWRRLTADSRTVVHMREKAPPLAR